MTGRRRVVSGPAAALAKSARAAWAAHKRLCWSCHAASGRPGLFCEEGFRLAQAVTQTRQLADLAAEQADRAQGTLL